MRVPHFVLLCVSATVLSLLYVWQQTEVFHLAYTGQKHLVKFEELLDENSALRYNLTRKTSLTRMGSKVAQNTEFRMPDNYCLVKMPVSEKEIRSGAERSVGNGALLARMFGFKRQAEAKTINPSDAFAVRIAGDLNIR